MSRINKIKDYVMRGGRRRHGGSIEEDETTVMIDGGAEERQPKEKKWRYLPLGKWEPVLNGERDLKDVFAVFPGGIFLKLASNANNFHVELILDAPPFEKPFSVVVPPCGAVYDLSLLKAPPKNGPRSEEWCTMFGVITRANLAGGIVERRQDGTLVVYRTFRRKPNMLTPFGLYFSNDPLRVSETALMVITSEDFENILRDSCGADASSIRIMAKPLLDKDKHRADEEGTLPLHVQLSHPVVLTVPPPPTDTSQLNTNAESLL